jgi:hypothetical protein
VSLTPGWTLPYVANIFFANSRKMRNGAKGFIRGLVGDDS